MGKKRLHTLSIIVGSILALAITFSQFLTPEACTAASKVKTEQTDSKDGDEAGSYISLPSFSLPAPVHVRVNLDAYCLFEIFFEEDTDANHVEQDLFFTDHLFATMFRVIISPNAP